MYLVNIFCYLSINLSYFHFLSYTFMRRKIRGLHKAFLKLTCNEYYYQFFNIRTTHLYPCITREQYKLLDSIQKNVQEYPL